MHRASERAIVAAGAAGGARTGDSRRAGGRRVGPAPAAASAETDSQALDTNASTTTGNNMEKPSARGPPPGRKAVPALGARLNRNPKQPPPLPSKKKISNADRAVNR